jgi:hypothetical protein
MSTPSKKRALKALNKAKQRNLERVASGRKPIVDGKRVSPRKVSGLPNTKKGAKEKLAAQKKKKGK